MIAEEHTRRVYFVHLAIESAPLYVNSSGQDLYWGTPSNGLVPSLTLTPSTTLVPDAGEVTPQIKYLGVGAMGSISGLGEGSSMDAAQITLGISGVGSDIITELQANAYQERPVYIYENDLSENYQVESSQLVWAGRMDTASFELGDTATVQMTCESALSRWNRPTPRRMNDQTQQRLYTGDRGLEFAAIIGNVSIEL